MPAARSACLSPRRWATPVESITKRPITWRNIRSTHGTSLFCTTWIRAPGHRLWPSNCNYDGVNESIITGPLMRLILCLALTAHCVAAQPAAGKLDSLHDLSANLEALSHRVSCSVVQIFATGFA